MIRERGGLPLLYPCLAIVPAEDFTPLDDALCRLGDYDWLVFTSSNAVAAVAERLRLLPCRLDWRQLSIAGVGAQTNQAIRQAFGRPADFLPERADARTLAQTLPLRQAPRILLPQADRADAATANILLERGAALRKIIAYRTIIGRGGINLAAQSAQGELQAVTFASPSAVEFLLQRCPQPELLALPAACIGATTASTARRLGFSELVVPKVSGLSKMLDALADFFLEQMNVAEEL